MSENIDERAELNRLSRAVLVNEVLRLRKEVARLKIAAYDQNETLIDALGELCNQLKKERSK